MQAKFVFEAIIPEKNFDEYFNHIKEHANEIETLEDLNKLSEPYDIFFSEYDDFLPYLDDEEKKVAPPKNIVVFPEIGVKFALYNKHLDKMHVVITDPKNWVMAMKDQTPTIKNRLSHILKHESVHQQQVARMPRGKEIYNLKDSPTDRDKYFSNKWEMMAFAQSMVDEMSDRFNKDQVIEFIKAGYGHPLLDQIYKRMDKSVHDKFLKYAMAYAEGLD